MLFPPKRRADKASASLEAGKESRKVEMAQTHEAGTASSVLAVIPTISVRPGDKIPSSFPLPPVLSGNAPEIEANVEAGSETALEPEMQLTRKRKAGALVADQAKKAATAASVGKSAAVISAPASEIGTALPEEGPSTRSPSSTVPLIPAGSWIPPSSVADINKAVEEISKALSITHLDPSLVRGTPAEKVGMGLYRRLAHTGAYEQMRSLPSDRLLGRAGWALSEVCCSPSFQVLMVYPSVFLTFLFRIRLPVC